MATNFVDTSDFLGRALLVQGIRSVHSQWQNVDKLTIHFQKRMNKGGDITKVLYPLDSNRDAAIVVFEDAKDRDTTLHHPHVFNGVSLQVQSLPPVFRSVEVEIEPVYTTLLPDVVQELMRRQKPSGVPSFGRQNSHKLSFSSLSELKCTEEEVYLYIGTQSETANLSSGATSYCGPQQVEMTGQERICTDATAISKERNIFQHSDVVDPEDFTEQLQTKRDDFAAPASGRWMMKENKTSNTDVQTRGPREQTNDYDDEVPSDQKNSVVLDTFSFGFLMKYEKAAVEKILKKYSVRLVKKEVDFSLKVTFVPCQSKEPTKEVQQAVDEFTTLYQTTDGKLFRKTLDCPNVPNDRLEEAASQTSELFRSNVFITRLDGNPLRYVFLSSVDVEKVVHHFKKLADIKSSKKLKTPSHVPEDTKSASAQSSGSQYGKTNQSNQVEHNAHTPTTTSYNSLNATRGPNDAQSLDVPGVVQFVTKEGITVYIQKDDITMQRVDAIVCPSQTDLRNGGGAAKAIVKAAGYDLERWLVDYMKRYSIYRVNVTQCLLSPGFNLCPTIIHAVGPSSSYPKKKFINELYDTFLNCLHEAEAHKITSLAMPLIGSGMIAAPKKDCADTLVQAINDFSGKGKKAKYLRDIHLVNIDSEASEEIKLSFEALFQITSRSDPAAAKSGEDTPDAAHKISKDGDRLPNKDVQSDLKQMAASLSKADSDQSKSGSGSGNKASSNSDKTKSADHKTVDDECPICLQDFVKSAHVQELSCKHRFCEECITQHFQKNYRCPVCRAVCRRPKGNQPKGTMTFYKERSSLSGFSGFGTITINYNIPSGTQLESHPNPGQPFTGAIRTAYLPDNQEGQKVLALLKKAFYADLVFTVGRSVSSRLDNTVTWNDIHHKTNRSGGPSQYGYPDPDYLKRVTEDLAALGIK